MPQIHEILVDIREFMALKSIVEAGLTSVICHPAPISHSI